MGVRGPAAGRRKRRVSRSGEGRVVGGPNEGSAVGREVKSTREGDGGEMRVRWEMGARTEAVEEAMGSGK